MNTSTEGRGREAIRNKERLYFKFITEYFRNVHEDLFEKATKLYDEVKENNPNVRDLTKTVEFVSTVTPNVLVPRYYRQRQLKMNKTIHHQQQQLHIQHGPQMVLNIPLQRGSSPSTVSTPPPISTPSTVSTQTPMSTPISTPPTVSTPPLISTPPTMSTPPSPQVLPANIYEGLLKEIQEDPDLYRILNDITLPVNDDDMNPDTDLEQILTDFTLPEDINPYVWNDITTTEKNMF